MKQHFKRYLVLLCLEILIFVSGYSQAFSGKFNGVNSYVDLGFNLTNNGVRSITFDFTPANTIDGSGHDGYAFIARNDPWQAKEFGVYIRGTDWINVGNLGKLCFWYRDNGFLHEIMSNQSSWESGTCYHVAGIIDPAQGMKLYINGILQSQADPGGFGPVLADNIYRTTIGCWGDTYNRHFEGTINNLAVWNSALGVPDIQNTMSGIFNQNDPALIALYKFEEGSGLILNDASQNILNGNVYSMTWTREGKCVIPLSVATIAANSDILDIYPVPATDKIVIQVQATDIDRVFEIYDVLGKMILKKELRGEKTEVDLSKELPGIYFVRLGSVIKKIVKE